MSDKYILDEHHNIHPQADLVKWARWMCVDSNRRVGSDHIGNLHVSTVFLGVDHRFGFDAGPPILFETMIFDTSTEPPFNNYDEYQTRCCTWDEAMEMHAKAVRLAEGKE